MPESVSNASPLLYLHRIGTANWLPCLFKEIWAPDAVRGELLEGRAKGYERLTLPPVLG